MAAAWKAPLAMSLAVMFSPSVRAGDCSNCVHGDTGVPAGCYYDSAEGACMIADGTLYCRDGSETTWPGASVTECEPSPCSYCVNAATGLSDTCYYESTSNGCVNIDNNQYCIPAGTTYTSPVTSCAPTGAPTPSPTPAPTPSPTPAQTTGGASAKGDPHLQNLHGERFDLTRPGKVTLIHIPRGQPVEEAFLVVEANARQLGGHCADLYFVELNVTGQWAERDLQFNAQGVRDDKPTWSKFGPVELKVAQGRTEKGFMYLNFYVKHLGRVGATVGGLLGEDDHTEAAKPDDGCYNKISLQKTNQKTAKWQGASVAKAYQ